MKYTEDLEPVDDNDYRTKAEMLGAGMARGCRHIGGVPEEFGRPLYEAVCVHDGTVAAELDRELDAEFGDEDE